MSTPASEPRRVSRRHIYAFRKSPGQKKNSVVRSAEEGRSSDFSLVYVDQPKILSLSLEYYYVVLVRTEGSCSLVENSVEGMDEVLQYRLLRGLSTAGAGGAATAAGAAAAAAAGGDEPPPWSAHASTLQDPHSVNPYTTTGFIIWYCFLFLCCGLPIICCCISVCCLAICKRCHPADDSEGDAMSGYSIGQEANDLELEIARIEANVHTFSLKEQQSRRSKLENAWIHHKMVSRVFS